MDLYAQNILDRYKTPFFKDKKIKADLKRHEANHSCGDAIDISLSTKGGKVVDYSFTGAGCAISMAAADMMGDLVKGMTEDEILKLTKDDIYKMLGIEISMRRSKCALLGLITLQNAILAEQKKPLRTWGDYHI